MSTREKFNRSPKVAIEKHFEFLSYLRATFLQKGKIMNIYDDCRKFNLSSTVILALASLGVIVKTGNKGKKHIYNWNVSTKIDSDFIEIVRNEEARINQNYVQGAVSRREASLKNELVKPDLSEKKIEKNEDQMTDASVERDKLFIRLYQTLTEVGLSEDKTLETARKVADKVHGKLPVTVSEDKK